MADTTIRFDCSICLEQIEALPKDARRVVRDSDDRICVDCTGPVIEQFRKALENEHDYPPKWAEQHIDLDLWKDLLGEEFMKQYEKKIAEYRTPIKHRRYCQHTVNEASEGGPAVRRFCNTFLTDTNHVTSSRKRVFGCPVCKNFTCLECSGTIEPHSRLQDHVCVDTKSNEQSDAFDPNTRGVEWQQCPNQACGVKLGLKDGCNAMNCSFCSTDFCFLCGAQALHDSDHWTRGVGNPCPRWGKPSAENPRFDDPPPAEQPRNIHVVLEGQEHEPVEARESITVIDAHLEADHPSLVDGRIAFMRLLNGLNFEIEIYQRDQGLYPIHMRRFAQLVLNMTYNLDYIIVHWSVHDAPRNEQFAIDGPHMAVMATNSEIRHERLIAYFIVLFEAALQEARAAGPESILHNGERFTRWLYAQYSTQHWPRHIASAQRVTAAQEVNRRVFFVPKPQEQAEREALRQRLRLRAQERDEAVQVTNRGKNERS